MCIVCTNTCKHTQSVSSSCLIKHTSSLRSLSIYVCFLNANDGLARALASGFSLFIPMFVSVLSLRSLFSCCHVTVTHGPSLIMRGPNERVLRTEKTSIPLFSILVDWIFPLFPSELWENRSLPLVNRPPARPANLLDLRRHAKPEAEVRWEVWEKIRDEQSCYCPTETCSRLAETRKGQYTVEERSKQGAGRKTPGQHGASSWKCPQFACCILTKTN